jgi:hypothetical protein
MVSDSCKKLIDMRVLLLHNSDLEWKHSVYIAIMIKLNLIRINKYVDNQCYPSALYDPINDDITLCTDKVSQTW